jgi:hypothetical protein
VEDFGSYLQRASGDRLLHDAEEFARRRPWAVAGIGVVAGLAASRFLKASSERRYGSRASGYPSSTVYGSGSDAYGTRAYEPNGRTVGAGVR